jgi:hypothetical protein
MNWSGDILATVTFYPTDAGGRRGPTPAKWFGCIITMDEQNYFDVRLLLEHTGPVAPGQTVTVPIKFLDLENAKTSCAVRRKFFIREINFIGEGIIEELSFLNDHGKR